MPEGVAEEVRSRADELEARDCEQWMRVLQGNYPKMPEEDRAEISKLAYSLFLSRAGRGAFAARMTPVVVKLYVLDRYTGVKLRAPFAEDLDTITDAHEDARKIIASWEKPRVVNDEHDPEREDTSELAQEGENEPASEDRSGLAMEGEQELVRGGRG